MLKSLPLTFVQQALEQTLLEERIKNNHYFGGKDQISLVSFYEQLKTQNEIDRFVETVRDLNDQQNRTGLIGNGVLLSPENPTITNLYSSTIIPFTWTCSVRTTLGNRDAMVETLQNLIEKLKGRKCDIAQLECEDFEGKQVPSLFKVGTLGQNEGQPIIKSGDYIGDVGYNQNTDTRINALISSLLSKGLSNGIQNGDYLYFTKVGAYSLTNNLCVARFSSDPILLDDHTPYVSNVVRNGATITGKLHFNSNYNGFTEVPPSYTNTLVAQFEVKDHNITNIYESEIIIDVSNSYVDENGYIQWVGSFSLSIDLEQYADPSEITTEWYRFTSDYLNTSYFYQIEDDRTYPNIIFPPEQTGAIYDRYKLSLSFDSFRIDEPHNLNGNEYCEISFGGSATLCNNNVYLGNDLVKVGVQKNKILAETPITFSGATTYYLEPLELPSGLNANTQITQLISNNFKQNTHTDGTAGVLQYSFIMDKSFDILKQWFNYARFGTYGITANDICPNLIYNVSEFWSSWGDVDKHTMLCKITESIDIENTESDVLTLGVNFQIQGANN